MNRYPIICCLLLFLTSLSLEAQTHLLPKKQTKDIPELQSMHSIALILLPGLSYTYEQPFSFVGERLTMLFDAYAHINSYFDNSFKSAVGLNAQLRYYYNRNKRYFRGKDVHLLFLVTSIDV